MNTLKRDVTQHNKTVKQMEAEQQARSGWGGERPDPDLPQDPLTKIKNDVETDPVFTAHVLKNWIQDKG